MKIHEDELPHLPDFIRLNELWIGEAFGLEDVDRTLAADPASIIRDGGHVFTAVVAGEVVGAVALFCHSDGELELARLTVASHHRRRGIGRALALAAVAKARASGARKLSLSSNTKLAAALALYRELGFAPVAGGHSGYSRCNVVMEMVIGDAG